MDPLFSHLADSVSRASTLEELTRPLLEMLREVTQLESTYLTTIDLDEGLQHILYSLNEGAMQIPEGLSVPWDDTLCKRSLDEGRSYTADVGDCWGDSDAARELGINTYVSTPVRTGGGALYGTLCAASASNVPLRPNVEKVLVMFARLIGQHVERERLLAQLKRANEDLAASALLDPLTGLPNRRAMMQELPRMLARAQRDGSALVVAFIDLDGFKKINDTHGHGAGDELLESVGKRIASGRRKGDFVARIGGDEFVVLAPVPTDGAGHVAELLRASIIGQTAGDYVVAGHGISYAGASVGVAVSGADTTDPDELLDAADVDMYRVKRSRQQRGGEHGAEVRIQG